MYQAASEWLYCPWLDGWSARCCGGIRSLLRDLLRCARAAAGVGRGAAAPLRPPLPPRLLGRPHQSPGRGRAGGGDQVPFLPPRGRRRRGRRNVDLCEHTFVVRPRAARKVPPLRGRGRAPHGPGRALVPEARLRGGRPRLRGTAAAGDAAPGRARGDEGGGATRTGTQNPTANLRF